MTKDSDTDTSSSEDDYSKKRTPICTVKDWSPKTKHEREEVERIPNKKQTTSHYKETPEKKPSALEGILPEEEGGVQIQKNVPKKRSSSVSQNKFKPKIIQLAESPEQPSKKTARQSLSAYKFEFNEEQKEINLRDDLSIESQEENIRNEFDIDPSQPIIFIFINKGGEENIKDMKQPMKTFKKGIIRINRRAKPAILRNKIKPTTKPVQKTPPSEKESKTKPKQKSEPKTTAKTKPESETKMTRKEKEKPESGSSEGDMTEYICQIGNDEDDIERVKLGAEATVETMKERIGKLRNVEDFSTIKVTFAGKELLNDIKLAPMKIGQTKLYIYIPLSGDFLLKTAKALQKNKNGIDDYD